MLGRGRPSIKPSIGPLRELTAEEVRSTPRQRANPTQKFRDSHHRMARLFAAGLRVKEVAELTGYSVSRVSLFHSNPGFQALIVEKRAVEDEIARDKIAQYNDLILANGLKAERKLADKLDDDDETEQMSVRELISIARDAADRVGLSKRSVQTNISVDFAAMLDRAISRSSVPTSGDLKLVSPPGPDVGTALVAKEKVIRLVRRI